MKLSLAGLGASVASLSAAQSAFPTYHYAPDRSYHLVHTSTNLDVDTELRRAQGNVDDTFTMLRDGVTRIHFDTSAEKVSDVRLDGQEASFTLNGGSLEITVPKSRAGETHKVSLKVGGSFFRWSKPTKEEPARIGFCAEGLQAQPVAWAPPNDLSTTEVSLTVPNAWTVISNGSLVSDRRASQGRHTVTWRCDLPHAGYLNSLAAGPFDVIHDTWRGKPLIMTCPQGMGAKLANTFAPTKDVLSFYSDILRFPYPWSKYGQEVIYEHEGYAEEDVSATEYPIYWGQGETLNDQRDGMNPTQWVIAHETAHQWFGDTVTCNDWSDTWLNEGFATFMEMMYTLHSRGDLESLREIESYSQRYFASSKTDFRPIATNLYSDSLGMFGATTYFKGGTVLNSLRREIGDDAFFRGLHRYLDRHKFSNVESNDLCEDLSDASGINLHAWFDQWIYKPGNPVIDWDWSYDAARKLALVRVRQTQDTTKGTPIYDVPTHIGIIGDTGLSLALAHLNVKEQTFEIPAPVRPHAVIFDPDHEFVRELPKQPWADAELPYVFNSAPNPIDMEAAMGKLLDRSPSDETILMIARRLSQDTASFPAIRNTSRLAALKRPALRSFWVSEINHPNYDRRMHAATGLAGVAAGEADFRLLHRLLRDDQPYAVVAAALRGLATLDFASVREFAALQARNATFPELRSTALDTLADHKTPGWDEAILDSATEDHRPRIREIGLRRLERLPHEDSRIATSLRSALGSGEPAIVTLALDLTGRLRQRALKPDLERMKALGQHTAEVDASLKLIE